MSWIRTVDEPEATGKLEEIYEEIKKQRGKISNIMRVHSLNPKATKAHMDLYLTVMFEESRLSREECELIATVVSSVNSCDYCVTHHAEALNHYWKNQRRVQQLIQNFQGVDLPEKTRQMLEYAVKLTKTPSAVSQNDVHVLRQFGYSDEDILSINLIISYFNFVNRIASGLGVEFTPDEVRGYKY
ncbi:MAG: peroxidase [candidate division Zixibacteria bacterium SM1_73]|nr:MAG: peroxidase [candidate division Zixibacteria bacterium SM1_73]